MCAVKNGVDTGYARRNRLGYVPMKYAPSANLASLTGRAPAGARPANGKPFGGSAATVARLNTVLDRAADVWDGANALCWYGW
ncbi:MAG: hypothetical protein LBP26_07485 [Clostridiales bacterium]|nr:hypothetical protein [Clostridiales bacterium]